MVILYDVLLRVDKFLFPADFIILDYEIDFKVLIKLERQFLTTRRALTGVEYNNIKFWMNNEDVTFMCASP